MGSSVNVLEDLRIISLGSLTFLLPFDLEELQENLGGVGECVRVGYSFYDLGNTGLKIFERCFLCFFFFFFKFSIFFSPCISDVPTASLTFYSIDCETGDWYDTQYTIHNTTHNTQHTTHNTQHTTHNTQHTTHNTQHTTHNTQHTSFTFGIQGGNCNYSHRKLLYFPPCWLL